MLFCGPWWMCVVVSVQLLTRLEINNQPVWGLTQEERELVRIAREKVNSC